MTSTSVKDLIGVEFKPYSFVVERGKILELVNAIGDPNPIYRSLEAAMEAGYEGIPLPLTGLQPIDNFGGYGFAEKKEVLKGINPTRILHGEQEYEFLGEIYAGDTLTVTSKLVDVVVKTGGSGGMDLITFENQYTNQFGRLVAFARNTLIHRH
ncbi:MaoC family dehydratase N-terminal domain-containing protein [Gottfriedia acidiceleris]|uniref:MaoC family dehydratase N-terminal domain-containing protein n=1 Tax=Gottfriedia acidiceleris TaxID=371036 RepID=UPI003D244DDF